MKTIRWGIIGCGDVTEVKSGPGFQQAQHSELVAVMRRNGKLAEDYAKRHGVPRWYTDADRLIHDPEVDAVYVATPPSSHMEYTIKSALAGKPVYVEKPMAMNYAECQMMIQACETARVPLFVAYYRRALPRFIKIKNLIHSGAIGEIRFVTIKMYAKATLDEIKGTSLPWRVLPEISGGGKFLDVGSHTLDILDFILGPIQSVTGNASNLSKLYAADDTVTANFVFSSGAHGVGAWCFTGNENVEINEIVGSKGSLQFATYGSEPIKLTTTDGITNFQIDNPLHIQQPMIQTIVNELNGQESCSSTGNSGARTTWVMDEIVKKYRRQ